MHEESSLQMPGDIPLENSWVLRTCIYKVHLANMENLKTLTTLTKVQKLYKICGKISATLDMPVN